MGLKVAFLQHGWFVMSSRVQFGHGYVVDIILNNGALAYGAACPRALLNTNIVSGGGHKSDQQALKQRV